MSTIPSSSRHRKCAIEQIRLRLWRFREICWWIFYIMDQENGSKRREFNTPKWTLTWHAQKGEMNWRQSGKSRETWTNRPEHSFTIRWSAQGSTNIVYPSPYLARKTINSVLSRLLGISGRPIPTSSETKGSNSHGTITHHPVSPLPSRPSDFLHLSSTSFWHRADMTEYQLKLPFDDCGHAFPRQVAPIVWARKIHDPSIRRLKRTFTFSPLVVLEKVQPITTRRWWNFEQKSEDKRWNWWILRDAVQARNVGLTRKEDGFRSGRSINLWDGGKMDWGIRGWVKKSFQNLRRWEFREDFLRNLRRWDISTFISHTIDWPFSLVNSAANTFGWLLYFSPISFFRDPSLLSLMHLSKNCGWCRIFPREVIQVTFHFDVLIHYIWFKLIVLNAEPSWRTQQKVKSNRILWNFVFGNEDHVEFLQIEKFLSELESKKICED